MDKRYILNVNRKRLCDCAQNLENIIDDLTPLYTPNYDSRNDIFDLSVIIDGCIESDALNNIVTQVLHEEMFSPVIHKKRIINIIKRTIKAVLKKEKNNNFILYAEPGWLINEPISIEANFKKEDFQNDLIFQDMIHYSISNSSINGGLVRREDFCQCIDLQKTENYFRKTIVPRLVYEAYKKRQFDFDLMYKDWENHVKIVAK